MASGGFQTRFRNSVGFLKTTANLPLGFTSPCERATFITEAMDRKYPTEAGQASSVTTT